MEASATGVSASRRPSPRFMLRSGPTSWDESHSTKGGVNTALRELDGTPTLARLGANAVLAASLAKALAAAGSVGTPLWRALSAHLPLLPLPMVR